MHSTIPVKGSVALENNCISLDDENLSQMLKHQPNQNINVQTEKLNHEPKRHSQPKHHSARLNINASQNLKMGAESQNTKAHVKMSRPKPKHQRVTNLKH